MGSGEEIKLVVENIKSPRSNHLFQFTLVKKTSKVILTKTNKMGEMNKATKITLIVTGLIIIGGIIYLIVEFNKQKKRIAFLENDRLRLQKFLFDKYENSDDTVAKEINILISEYSNTNAETVKSLDRAKKLYTEGHKEESIRKLAVIIENKLKAKFENDKDEWFLEFKENKRKHIGLSALLERAKKLNLFNDLEYSLGISIAGIRNNESHKEGYFEEKNKSFIGIFGCIEIIKKLKQSSLEMV